MHQSTALQKAHRNSRLLLTCRACGVDPLSWLRHVLTELPQRDEAADIRDLLPFNYSKTTAA